MRTGRIQSCEDFESFRGKFTSAGERCTRSSVEISWWLSIRFSRGGRGASRCVSHILVSQGSTTPTAMCPPVTQLHLSNGDWAACWAGPVGSEIIRFNLKVNRNHPAPLVPSDIGFSSKASPSRLPHWPSVHLWPLYPRTLPLIWRPVRCRPGSTDRPSGRRRSLTVIRCLPSTRGT